MKTIKKINKCACGKTKDVNGNCDGSHTKRFMGYKIFTLMTIALITFFSIQSFSLIEKETIDVSSAKIVWKAYKVTGSHEGTISLKSGKLNFINDELIGGDFKVDMNSILCTDLSGDYKNQLEGHLKSEDFFNSKNHPNSTLTFTKVKSINKNSYNIDAEITIKGKKETISFVISVYGNKATGVLKIDRTKFDIKYGSGSFFAGLGDNLIYDEFDLIIDINF
ncbi:MAG: Protein YceI [Flavobacteriaceae bacterium]|nr:MAG: Protein YceI [Flavobacteriaceae bacterium]